MTTTLHICEKCGNEKEIYVNPDINIGDVTCQCKAPGPSDYSPSFLELESIDLFHKHSHSGHSCGCGSGECGCN